MLKRIGSSNRPNFLLAKANPGPGQYDIRGGVMGPKWGFWNILIKCHKQLNILGLEQG